MAETLAKLGFGTVLQFETVAASGTYATIEEMQDFPPFGDDVTLVKVTHQESPGTREEYISGIADGSEITASFNFIKSATQEAVRAAKGTKRNFRHTFPTTVPLTQTYAAVIMSAKVSGPHASQMMLELRLKVSGAITDS